MSCGVGHRCDSDPTLLWLWQRPAAVALIRPLAWEPPNAAGATLKSKIKLSIKNINLKKLSIWRSRELPFQINREELKYKHVGNYVLVIMRQNFY